MNGWDWELGIITVLAVVTVWLAIDTVRYVRGKRRLIRKMKRFANEGDGDASLFVAEEYRKGDVVKKRCDHALFWYSKSAACGNEKAQEYLKNYRNASQKRC